MIPYGRQDVTQEDIDAVVSVLRSDFLTQGPMIPRFEQAVTARVKVAHAVAVNSATSALHIACLAIGLEPSDVLWTVPNTFVASANCARYCGSRVDFVDIDPQTWNMSVPALEQKLASARREGRVPCAVVAVHFAGQPTEQEAIWQLAQEYGFKVIEDASHAIGAARHGEPVGSCKWSDVTIFSFHPVKIVTSGEGGMALTNDAGLAERMQLFRTHGITRDPARFREVGPASQRSQGPAAWHYEQQALGFNYRMTDVHAALGLSQLSRLDDYVERRNVLARRYDRLLRGLPLTLPHVQPGNRSAFHLYAVRLPGPVDPGRHREVFDELRRAGIGVNVHYTPVHLQPYYRELGFAAGQFPQAEAHGASVLTLPLYATLTEEQQDRVVQALEQVLGSRSPG